MSEENYVAWLCFRHRDDQPYLSVCDSDTPGAFKVYRHPTKESSFQADYDALLKERDAMCSAMAGGHVEEYIASLSWSPEAKDREKTLVAGNIRAFVYWFHMQCVKGLK